MPRRILVCNACHCRFVAANLHVRTCYDCPASRQRPRSPILANDNDKEQDSDHDDKPLLALIRSHQDESLEEEAPWKELEETVTPTDRHLTVCFVCGATLSHIGQWKGRLQHVKRCAKQNGVTAKEVSVQTEGYVENGPLNNNNNSSNNNKTDWHGEAEVDLALAEKESKDEKPSAFAVLMAGARRMAQAPPPAPIDHRRGQGFGPRPYGSCPTYKKISGTDFVCDGFQYADPRLTRNYFLTHFHSDHYGGLTKSWNAGVIYCSLPTANLVHEQLRVDRSFLHPLPMQRKVVLHSQGRPVSVVLLDANHCPGAVMLLFTVGNRTVLHVGDFRWNRNIMSAQTALQPFLTGQQRLNDLYLDTTYCDPKYTLPTQDEAIQATVAIASKEYQKYSRMRLLLLFGAYTIGKERIYLAVAERLGLKVYVDKRRYRILQALDWPRERLDRFTTSPHDTCLWVVPLGHINMKKLPSYLSLNKGGPSFDRVIGFRPTGWSLSTKGQGLIKSSVRGAVTVHSVPYSEHSSFPELVDCVASLRPQRIIPTVSVSKSQEQVDLILRHVKDSL